MSVYTTHAAVDYAKQLIKNGDYVTDTDWSEVQPSPEEENQYLENNGYEAFAKWHLAKDTDDNQETKGRHLFPYGDFKKVHRSGVIAAKQRAAQNHYNTVQEAADELLQMIDERENKS